MKNDKFQDLMQYQMIMGWAKNLLHDGIITKAEYAKIDTKMHKKHGLSSASILRQSA